jgi:hypothetical protein
MFEAYLIQVIVDNITVGLVICGEKGARVSEITAV